MKLLPCLARASRRVSVSASGKASLSARISALREDSLSSQTDASVRDSPLRERAVTSRSSAVRGKEAASASSFCRKEAGRGVTAQREGVEAAGGASMVGVMILDIFLIFLGPERQGDPHSRQEVQM